MEKLVTGLWDEFFGLPATDADAELAGFLSFLPAKSDGGFVLVDTRRLSVARRMLKICGDTVGWKRGNTLPDGMTLELDKGRGRALFRMKPDFYVAASGCGTERLSRAKRRWAWFRGAWGACGALYTPREGYYMALRAPLGSSGELISSALRSAGIVPGVRVNRGRNEYMIRDLEGVVTLLSRMGLVRTSLLLEDTAVLRSVRGMANKMVNCDAANIVSSLAAARTQTALVDAIDENGLWNELPPRLSEIARARKENPSASLRELGEILSKPVSKSTVGYRWKKLETLIGEKM